MDTSSDYDFVLVPLDGSLVATEALPPAVSFAREASCRLVLLHVVPADASTSTLTDLSPERRVQRSQMDAYLHDLRRSLSNDGMTIDTKVVVGEPASTIVGIAQALGRGLVVLTDSGAGSRISRPGNGGVYRQVAATWPGPLLVVNT